MTTDLNKDGYIAGKVDYWEVISNKIYLGIDGKLYDIDDLDTVMDDDYYKKWNKMIQQQILRISPTVHHQIHHLIKVTQRVRQNSSKKN